MYEVTQDWLDEVTDELGLTKGQKQLMDIWCKYPYVDEHIPYIVRHVVTTCRGYRGMPEDVKHRMQ